MDTETARVTAWVNGEVQGVGFRFWVRARAAELGVYGSVGNLPDGRVQVMAEGDQGACRRLVDTLRDVNGPGRVDSVAEQWERPRGDVADFTTW